MTFFLILAAPKQFFKGIGPGSIASPFYFYVAYLCVAWIPSAVFSYFFPSFANLDTEVNLGGIERFVIAICVFPIILLLAIAASMVLGVLLHGVCLLLRGKAQLSISVRAMMYCVGGLVFLMSFVVRSPLIASLVVFSSNVVTLSILVFIQTFPTVFLLLAFYSVAVGPYRVKRLHAGLFFGILAAVFVSWYVIQNL